MFDSNKIETTFDIYSFANANVLLVLGELMGGDDGEDGAPSRSAIPLIGGAIVTAQFMMVRRIGYATFIQMHIDFVFSCRTFPRYVLFP